MHTKSSWHIGPSLKHFRCYDIFILSTKSIRIGDKVEFCHSNHKMPKISNTDTIIDAATQLAETSSSSLTKNQNKMRAFHDKYSKHIQSLSSILSEITKKHKTTLTCNLFSLKPIPSTTTHHTQNLTPTQLLSAFQYF